MPSATRKSDENMLSQLFPTGKVVRRRRRHSMRHIVQLLSSACLMLFLCLSKTHAVYDEGGVGRPSSSNEQFIAPIHQSNEGSLAQIPEADRLVWEYLAKKYSASGTAFTPSELINMAKSMQKCHGGDTSGKIINSNLNSILPEAPSPIKDVSEADDSSHPQVSNCNRVINSFAFTDAPTNGAYHYDQSSFGKVCQRILYYIENEECCAGNDKPLSYFTSADDAHGIPSSTGLETRNIQKKDKPTTGEVWGYGILLVTIISLSSLVGVSLMPFMAKAFYKHLLTVMIGLAVGSLTGSAIFHLLPQAFQLADHDPDHGYLHISLVVVGGIWLFFMVERFLKFIMDYKERKGKNWKREKMSSVLASTPESSTIAMMNENGNQMKEPLAGEANEEQRNSFIFPTAPDTGVIYECQEQVIKASFGHQEKPRLSNGHDHKIKFEQGKDSVIATVAWMIIFGDGLHNFIDGLSIGAAFNESIWTGVSISVAVLCEELPHELGDFAVLLNAGMSTRQAVTYNFLSACTCYIGMAVGIFLGKVEASTYIFALAAGMFLYISLVDMVPEMNEIAQETSKISVKHGLITILLQNIGLFTGITALYLLALYQDSFQFS